VTRLLLHVGRPGAVALAGHLERAARDVPTYDFVGASLGATAPPGIPTHEDSHVVGHGQEGFDRAVAALRGWRQHRAIGARPHPEDPPIEMGTTLLVVLRALVVSVVAPCRIVRVVDEPDRFGFAYASLPGHPERGEESFVVERAGDDTVRFRIRVVAEPATPLLRALTPLVTVAQRLAVRRYLRGLR
jgi:uncharacterized protein (UPF0548 family)